MVRKVALHIGLPFRKICNVVLGKSHSTSHRLGAGVVTMVAGVSLAHAAPLIQASEVATHLVSGVFDLVGYFVHALGATPFIELLGMEEED